MNLQPERQSLLTNALALVVSVAACFGAAAIGSAFTSPAIPTWYAGLSKPAWTPPSWLFGPVWTLLYLSMGVAAWLVWRERANYTGVRLALLIFGVQLALNALWSIIFFGMKRPGLAFIEIMILWEAILLTFLAFRRIDTLAALLLLPYLLWVSFAALLNFTIWRMNS